MLRGCAVTARPLRPHQELALDRLRLALAGGKLAPMFQASTGFGKTRVMSEIASRALAKGKRVLITVPAVSLVDQTVADLEAEGVVDVGVMQAMHERTDGTAPIQVASVQTLQRRKMPACDLILIDEAHRWYQFFGRMMLDARAAKKPVIGFSATPWTKGLGKHFDDLINVISTKELIEQGYLSPFRVFAPSHPDLSDVRTVAGDYHEGELAEVMGQADLIADVVTTWLRHAEDRPTLCFAVDRAHAKKLQVQFEAAGVPTAYVDAFTSREERTAIRDRFHAGDVKVVANVGCLTTGVDWDVRCISFCRPSKSEMLYVQIIGRGLRTAPGKQDCLILDHSDTTLRLGFVTDIVHEKLDDGVKSVAEPRHAPQLKPRECPKCHFVRAPKVHACPSCGFAPERQSQVEIADGELIELGAERHARLKAGSAEKARFYAELLTICRNRGYAIGWAANQFRNRYGVWPNHYKDVQPQEPSPGTLNWVKSRQIAYAKRRTA